jgi:ribosomal-protein-alanine N-acetyltransferase
MKKSYLETKRLILRAIESADFESLYRFRSLPVVYRYVVADPDTKKDTATFMKWAIALGKKKHAQHYVWAVVSKETGNQIGKCDIHITDPDLKEGSIGYSFHPNYWNQGFATETTKGLIGYGFSQLKLHRLFATCDTKNAGSSKVLLKAGMKWEGTFRKNILQKGKWRDTHQYAIVSTRQ